MTKKRCDCKVVYARNPDVPQKPYLNIVKVKLLKGTWNNVAVNQHKEAG